MAEKLKDKVYDFFKFSDELVTSLRETNYGNSVAYNTAITQLKLYKSKLSFGQIGMSTFDGTNFLSL